jgi:Holliday junction resolvasome RuvABC ATP-dependent DNA helicase subunit
MAFDRYMIRFSDESSRMAKRKRKVQSIRRRLLEAPYSVDYFAQKHDISAEQARELMRKLGRDREKLNEAAARVLRR